MPRLACLNGSPGPVAGLGSLMGGLMGSLMGTIHHRALLGGKDPLGGKDFRHSAISEMTLSGEAFH